MIQASRSKPALATVLRGSLARGSRESALILLTAISLYLTLSLASYNPTDPGYSHTGHMDSVINRGGVVGAWLADVFLFLFGYMAYLFPLMGGLWGMVALPGYQKRANWALTCTWQRPG